MQLRVIVSLLSDKTDSLLLMRFVPRKMVVLREELLEENGSE